MRDVEAIWPCRKINITQKLKIYKTIVKSVLTYNYSTWGLTKSQTEELDRTHRKQLRKIWNDPYKQNKHLYRDSKEVPLSIDMKRARWRAFGHMLRLDDETPCQLAMREYFNIPEKHKKYSGRKRCTLPVIIDEDLKEAAVNNLLPVSKFENFIDLQNLKKVAEDRNKWRKFSELICKQAEDNDH